MRLRFGGYYGAAIGAGDVQDDGGGLVFIEILVLALDGGQGAEELLEDVGEHRGFFEGDAVLHEEDEEFAEEALGVFGSFDFGEGAEEFWSCDAC